MSTYAETEPIWVTTHFTTFEPRALVMTRIVTQARLYNQSGQYCQPGSSEDARFSKLLVKAGDSTYYGQPAGLVNGPLRQNGIFIDVSDVLRGQTATELPHRLTPALLGSLVVGQHFEWSPGTGQKELIGTVLGVSPANLLVFNAQDQDIAVPDYNPAFDELNCAIRNAGLAKHSHELAVKYLLAASATD